MSTIGDAERDIGGEAAPIGVGQLVAAAVMYLTGLGISVVISAYDAKPPVAACLTALNAVFSALALWWGLALVRVAPATRFSAALWVPLSWDFLLLSQLAYVGFVFIPLEALCAALVLRRRTRLTWGMAIAFGAVVRLLSLASTHAARPALKMLFPWSG